MQLVKILLEMNINIINASQTAFGKQVVKVSVCKQFVEELTKKYFFLYPLRTFYRAKRLLLVAKSFV